MLEERIAFHTALQSLAHAWHKVIVLPQNVACPKGYTTMRGERQAIVTELRDLGDKRTIVVYTNDNRVYRKLRDSVELIRIVTYEQEQGGKLALVAWDLHFPKECRKWLKKNIGIHTSGRGEIEMQNLDYKIIIPELEHLEQDEEYIIVDFGNRQEKVRLHDYGAIYKIPGLYEEIFHKHLKCNSPKVICDMLSNVLKESDCSIDGHRVLDFGAGNGIVGEEIKKRGCDLVVGVDILSEAKEAADRDRTGIYDNYYVMDFSQLDDKGIEKLEKYDFDTLVTVAALGFDDIPPRTFLRAFNLIKDDGWIAFNIKDRFLRNGDDTGYKSMLDQIMGKALSVYSTKRYCHRLSLGGEEINYIGIIGQKSKTVTNLLGLL